MDNFTFEKAVVDDEVILTVKVSSEHFKATKEKVYNKLAKDVTIQGFRAGKAPRALIEANISDKLFNETIGTVVPEITAEILVKEKANPMTQVNYEIVKFSDAEGLEYRARFFEMPAVKMPDVSKIDIKKDVKAVTDEMIEKESMNLVRYYKKSMNKDNVGQDEHAGHDHSDGHVHADEAEMAKGEEKVEATEGKEEEKIELTDELVKSLGLGIDTVEKLKEGVKIELEMNNQRNAESEWIDKVVVEAVKMAEVNVPKSMIKDAVSQRETDYVKKLEELNLNLEDFLKMQNMTIERLREDWGKESEKRFATELLLLEIIKTHNLTITDEEITKEIDLIKDEKVRKSYQNNEGRKYVATVLLQTKAVEWLKDNAGKVQNSAENTKKGEV